MAKFGMFQYCWLIWIINVVLAILSYFIAGISIGAVLMFPAVFVAFAMMLKYSSGQNIELTEVFKYSPSWAKAIAGLSSLYTIVNFIICMVLLVDGSAHIENGVYCLWNHGFVREITKQEYYALLKVEGRQLMGHTLAFTGIALAFFAAHRKMDTI